MSDVRRRWIPEEVVEGKRLGRHVAHDPRSRNFPADGATLIHDVIWTRHSPAFDQGSLGSCTGNAVAGALNTDPLIGAHTPLGETDAVELYSRATHLDRYKGVYPPDDTGSSGLAACKAAKEKGLIVAYRHAFSLHAAVKALMLGPLVTGVEWYEGFDHPQADGSVSIAGAVRGGHEFEVFGFEQGHGSWLDGTIWAWNSWGPAWGDDGRFCFTARTWGTLLEQQGDVTVPLVA